MADMIYRRYMIRVNPLNGLIYIERDRVHIGYAPSVNAARSTIDSLLDWAPVDPESTSSAPADAASAANAASQDDADHSWAPSKPDFEF